MKSNYFYSLPVIIFRRAGIQFVYGLCLLAIGLYGFIVFPDQPDEVVGIVSTVASWTGWVSKSCLMLGLFCVVTAIFKAISFRKTIFAQRAEFENLVANKESLITSKNREAFNFMAMLMAYEYELERSFYDASIWRDQSRMLAVAMVKMAGFSVAMMMLSNLVLDEWLPGLAIAIPCLLPWLLLGSQRPRNLFVMRAEDSGSIVVKELGIS